MADTEPPEGTAADVLDWVDNDPQRAQTALEAENCKDQPRSTLVTKLEAIAAKEAPVSTDTSTTTTEPVDEVDEDEIPEPEQPLVTEIYAEDAGTVIYGVAPRDTDVEVPEDAAIVADPEYDRSPEAAQARSRVSLDDVEPIGAEPVEYITGASNTSGLVLGLNGTNYGLNAQQVGQLKNVIDKAVVGLAL